MKSIARKLLLPLLAVTAATGVLAPRAARAIIVARTAVAYRPYRPVARAAVVVGATAVTAAAVGSVVRTLPPSCSTMVVGGVTYQQCGSTWYHPQYSGSHVTYVVVNPPR